jgi:hypothetical protein
MSRIVIDEQMRAKLNGFDQDLELCDESGKPVGHFVPQKEYMKMLIAFAEAQCPISPEELDRREQEVGGRTLAEIWRRLGVK